MAASAPAATAAAFALAALVGDMGLGLGGSGASADFGGGVDADWAMVDAAYGKQSPLARESESEMWDSRLVCSKQDQHQHQQQSPLRFVLNNTPR